MADQFITELDAITTYNNTGLVVIEHDPTGTPETNKMTLANFIDQLNLRIGGYTISRTISSNNLVVAIKDGAGNDATSNKPLYFSIGGTVRTLSGSLSLTVNAGTDVWNLGDPMFVAQDQDVFVYLGWRASNSSIFILLSRIPTGIQYADFSSTATDENYGAVSGAAPAATDKVTVIGRFNVRNSGSASYNWSVGLGNTVISQPIYNTSWMSWIPQFTNLTTTSGTLTARYQIDAHSLKYMWAFAFGASSAISGSVSHTLPFTRASTFSGLVVPAGIVRLWDAAPAIYQGITSFTSGTTANIAAQNASATYLTQAALSSTVPFTWATSDEIETAIIEYAI